MEPESTAPGAASRPPSVSIVVVTYATGPVVIEALAAVRDHTHVAHEVIVVDNLPADGRPRTADLLVESGWGGRSDEILVEAEGNLGFGGGCNLGAQTARGRYVCFLNPDVIVGPGWLDPLLAALADPVVGIAAPVFANPDGSLQEAGQLLYDDGCTAAIGGPEVMTGDWSQAFTRDVDYSSAACWLVRRAEFIELGGFDARYHPAYFEDVDYAMRVEARGQRTRLIGDVPVVHLHGQGGAGGDLALGEASQQVFRSIWPQRLTEQPPRPADDIAAIANRDRLASDVVGWLVSDASADDQRRVLATAAAFARSHPRERVCVLIDAIALDQGELHDARCAGVEVVDGDVDASHAARSRADSRWGHIAGSATLGLRHAARALWSPWTLVVAAVGLVLRVVILRSRWGELNADEAYTGLASMGVLDGRFPVVVDGNRYSAVFEAYLLAPVSAVVGPSVLALKLVPIVMWALAAVLTYFAAAAIVTGSSRSHAIRSGRRIAALAGAFVWITPGALLVVSTLAYASYAVGMAICVAVLLMSARLIDRDRADVISSALVGLLAGLAFYAHPMYVAILIPTIAPVAWVHRAQVRAFWLPALVGGVVGCGPLLAWNVANGFPSLEAQNSLPGSYIDRLDTFFSELIPRGYGLRDSRFDWVLGSVAGIVGYVVLVVLAIVGCIVMIQRGPRRSRWLVPIALAAAWPLMALFSPLIWSADGRYNVITFPYVTIAVAAAVGALPWRGRRWEVGAVVVAAALWAGLFVWPHTNRLISGGAVDANARYGTVIDVLEDHDIDKIAGSYWSVLVIEYLSDLDIIGAVSWPDPVRFPERQRQVEASAPDEVAFVFPTWAERPEMLWMPVDQYDRSVTEGTVIYLPRAAG